MAFFVLQTEYSLDVAILAEKAEDLGFESFWVAEHPVMPVNTPSSPYRGSPDGVIPDSFGRLVDPLVALARASAVTQTIRLGTAVCLVPERNPLLLAKEIATLDHFSGGRFTFGIGAGWVKEETEIMGGDFPHRWTQTREAVLAMKELWTKEEAEYHGRYYDFPTVRCFPKPAQKPHPPILPGIPQIKPTFLDIAPSGIPSNIIPHSKGVKCGLIRSNSPFSYSNHRPAKPKIPKPLVYAQVSPLGTSFATP